MKRLLLCLVCFSVMGLYSCNENHRATDAYKDNEVEEDEQDVYGETDEYNEYISARMTIDHVYVDRIDIIHCSKECPFIFNVNGTAPIRYYSRDDFYNLSMEGRKEFCSACVELWEIKAIESILKIEQNRTEIFNDLYRVYDDFRDREDFVRWLSKADEEHLHKLFVAYDEEYSGRFRNTTEMCRYLGYKYLGDTTPSMK